MVDVSRTFQNETLLQEFIKAALDFKRPRSDFVDIFLLVTSDEDINLLPYAIVSSRNEKWILIEPEGTKNIVISAPNEGLDGSNLVLICCKLSYQKFIYILKVESQGHNGWVKQRTFPLRKIKLCSWPFEHLKKNLRSYLECKLNQTVLIYSEASNNVV